MSNISDIFINALTNIGKSVGKAGMAALEYAPAGFNYAGKGLSKAGSYLGSHSSINARLLSGVAAGGVVGYLSRNDNTPVTESIGRGMLLGGILGASSSHILKGVGGTMQKASTSGALKLMGRGTTNLFKGAIGTSMKIGKSFPGFSKTGLGVATISMAAGAAAFTLGEFTREPEFERAGIATQGEGGTTDYQLVPSGVGLRSAQMQATGDIVMGLHRGRH